MITLRFSNESQVPRVIYVEPRADDFTLLPNEELEIRVANGVTFHMVEGPAFTQVFLENMTIDNMLTLFTVWQNGRELKGGHNREHNPHP